MQKKDLYNCVHALCIVDMVIVETPHFTTHVADKEANNDDQKHNDDVSGK